MDDTEDPPEHQQGAWQAQYLPLSRPPEFSQRDGVLRVEMHCPRCLAPTVREFELTLPGTKGGGSAPPDVTGEIVPCDCDYPHPGREPGSLVHGCGAEWRIPA